MVEKSGGVREFSMRIEINSELGWQLTFGSVANVPDSSKSQGG